MTETLEQKLQELKERFPPRDIMKVAKITYDEWFEDFEDFVELYQKTRQTLHQQIKDEFARNHPSPVDGAMGYVYDGDQIDDWEKFLESRVLALLDRPNEDYIVIKRKQFPDFPQLGIETIDVKSVMAKLEEIRDWYFQTSGISVNIIVGLNKEEYDKELLRLPNKKEK